MINKEGHYKDFLRSLLRTIKIPNENSDRILGRLQERIEKEL